MLVSMDLPSVVPIPRIDSRQDSGVHSGVGKPDGLPCRATHHSVSSTQALLFRIPDQKPTGEDTARRVPFQSARKEKRRDYPGLAQLRQIGRRQRVDVRVDAPCPGLYLGGPLRQKPRHGPQDELDEPGDVLAHGCWSGRVGAAENVVGEEAQPRARKT